MIGESLERWGTTEEVELAQAFRDARRVDRSQADRGPLRAEREGLLHDVGRLRQQPVSEIGNRLELLLDSSHEEFSSRATHYRGGRDGARTLAVLPGDLALKKRDRLQTDPTIAHPWECESCSVVRSNPFPAATSRSPYRRRSGEGVLDTGGLGVVPAARSSQLHDRQAGFPAEVAQPMGHGFTGGLG